MLAVASLAINACIALMMIYEIRISYDHLTHEWHYSYEPR